jgi:hypothetical protein
MLNLALASSESGTPRVEPAVLQRLYSGNLRERWWAKLIIIFNWLKRGRERIVNYFD